MRTDGMLQPGQYYHIYNRGNNRENIFVEERNYPYFLSLYSRHIAPVADTFAYCLMKNHFHLLIRVKEPSRFDSTPRHLHPSQAFSNLFNAYAKAMNKAYGRTGSLFQDRFRRIVVTSEHYRRRLIVYIHLNPQYHGFVDNFRDWPWSSYHGLCEDGQTMLQGATVQDWFGGCAYYEAAHAAIPLHTPRSIPTQVEH